MLSDFQRRYEPDDLAEFLEPVPELPATEPVDRRLPYIGPERPGSAFNARHTGTEVLAPLGFTLGHIDRNGDQHWCRPGKDPTQGTSATVYADDGHTTIWSETVANTWPAIEVRRPYDPFGLYAALHHGGDFPAATKELAGRGYGTPLADEFDSWISTDSADDGNEAFPEQPIEPGEWIESDLGPWLRGEYVPIVPSVLMRDDGQYLLYGGAINALWGESGSGKTWLALFAAAQEIEAGNRVLYVDFEDKAETLCDRIHAFGLPKEQVADGIRYVKPRTKWTDKDARYWAWRVHTDNITLAVMDSVGESMADEGVKSNDDDEVARWYRLFPQFATDLGVTLILIDHIPKSKERAELFAIGSQRKRAAINGIAWMVETLIAPDRTTDGQLRLVCAKDRHGNFASGKAASSVDIRNVTPEEVEITLRPYAPQAPVTTGDRILAFMRHISEGYANGDVPTEWLSAAQIISGVKGNKDTIRDTLRQLSADDAIDTQQRQGKGGGFEYRYKTDP